MIARSGGIWSGDLYEASGIFELSVGTAAVAALSRQGRAQTPSGKSASLSEEGVLVIARHSHARETFAPQGIAGEVVEFSFRPADAGGDDVGSIDYGASGDSPPVSRNRRVRPIVYAAGQPITNGQGILVPGIPRSAASRMKGNASLQPRVPAPIISSFKSRKSRSPYADITPVYLTPPDAGPAFATQHRCWSILGSLFRDRQRPNRTAVSSSRLRDHKTNSFYIANRDFGQKPWADPAENHRCDVLGPRNWAEAHRKRWRSR